MTTTTDRTEFEAWFKKADNACAATCGLGIEDLPDGPSWDSWESGMTPAEYVQMMLENEGF